MSWLPGGRKQTDVERDVTDLAAIQAANNHSPFEVRITFKQGTDGLPHASGVEATRKEGHG